MPLFKVIHNYNWTQFFEQSEVKGPINSGNLVVEKLELATLCPLAQYLSTH